MYKKVSAQNQGC